MQALGIVAWTATDKTGQPIAGVQPLFEVLKGEWRQIALDEFPTQGQAFWPAARDAQKDGLVFFNAVENSGGHKDEFKVTEPQLAIEVVDVRHIGSPEEVRLALVRGIPGLAAPAWRVILWCGDGSLVGPLKLVAKGGTTTFDRTNCYRIPIATLKPNDVRTIQVGPVAKHILSVAAARAPDGFVDWDEDKAVLRRALEFASERAKGGGVDVKLTRRLIEEVAGHVAKTGDGAELRLEQMRLTRAHALIARLTHVAGLAGDLVGLLRQHPAVEAAFKAELDSERNALAAENARVLEGESSALSEARKRRGEVESELASLVKQLKDLRAGWDEEARKVENAVAGRLAEALEKPAEVLASASVLGALMRHNQVPAARPSEQPEGRITTCPPWGTETVAQVSTVVDLRRRLNASLKAVGLPARVTSCLHSAFAGGLVPLLAGPSALETLDAYAQVATGGRLVVVQASAGLVEPGQIFGRVDNARGRFVPHPDGLLDVVMACEQSDRRVLVVIDGINRGATEAYLLPLIGLRNAPKRRLALFHPAAVSDTDPYGKHARLSWPSNMLLAGCLTEGPTTLPVAGAIWRDAVLVVTEPRGSVETSADGGVEPSEWTAWSSEATMAPATQDAIETLLAEMPSLRGALRPSARLAATLVEFGMDPDAIKEQVASAVILPWIASCSDEGEWAGLLEGLQRGVSRLSLEKLKHDFEYVRRIVR